MTMMYALHELQHAAAAPLRAWSEGARLLFGHPLSPMFYAPHSGRLAAGSELLARAVRRYRKPAFGLATTTIAGRDVNVSEEVVLSRPFCQLLHFKRDTDRQDPKLLLFAPLSGHYATLLRDTVRALLPEHDVYITDWVDARQVPLREGAFHFDDYVDYVQSFIRFLGPDVHLVSVCQPTVPVLAAVSLMAAREEPTQPRSMTLMGGPIDTRRGVTEVNRYATSKPLSWFERGVITTVPTRYRGRGRRVYPGFLQYAGFVPMNLDRHVSAHLEFYQHLVRGDGDSAEAHRRFYDEYNAVMDMPAEYYLETIDRVFQRHLLPRGEMVVAGEPVRPEAIRQTALLTVEGALDDISGPGQTEAAHDLCSGLSAERHAHLLVPEVGHYGIFSGRRWRETICPRIREFIRASQQANSLR